MNYLVTEGFKDAAERFQDEAGMNPGQDLSLLDNRIKIRDSIQAGNILDAISLVNELHPQLLDNDRYLLFHLQQLQRTLALLAFEDPEVSPFSDLLAPSHRQQVASQLNAAILRAEHAESSQSQLAVSLRKLLWAQEELDRKRVRYPHMNLPTTSIEEPK